MGKLNKWIMLCTLILICGIVITGCGCEHEWTPATCTEPATCLKCGETEGEPNGHTWIPATCTNPQTCSVCHETTGDIQPHAFGTPVVTLEPTCAEDGQQTLMCTNCGYTETEVLKRTGKHTVETWKTVTKPTCSEYGAEEGKCVICEEMIEQPMEKLEHTSDNNFVIVTAATASSDGTKATHCKVCGAELETESYSLTMEEKNALRSANDYLSFMAFSKKGLIEQLKYEGYSTEAATNAVNSLDVDWNEQAAKSAEQYLSFMSFSRSVDFSTPVRGVYT